MDISHAHFIFQASSTVGIGLLAVACIAVLVFLKRLSVNPRKTKLSFKDRHVLITGGSSGIGLAAAIDAARRGARVTIVARNEQRLQAAAEQIRMRIIRNIVSTNTISEPSKGDADANSGRRGAAAETVRVKAISADISMNPEDVAKAVAIAVENHGPIDILINCAGLSIPKVFEDLTIAEFENMLRVNYLGAVMLTKLVVPQMKRQQNGHIVFVSSMAGQVGIFGFSGYSPSKFALRGLAEALHMELKPYNIGITISYPPDTDTPGFAAENASKPPETHLICETAGLYQPEVVARRMLDDVENNKFHSYLGLDGFMLSILTAGMAPLTSVRDGLCQLLFTGVFRFVALVYRHSFDRIVSKGASSRRLTTTSSSPSKEARKTVTFKE